MPMDSSIIIINFWVWLRWPFRYVALGSALAEQTFIHVHEMAYYRRGLREEL
jgi:hypothetical protein